MKLALTFLGNEEDEFQLTRSSVLTLTLPLKSVSNTLWERASRKLPWVGKGYRIYLQLLGMRIQLDSHFPDSRYQELSEH